MTSDELTALAIAEAEKRIREGGDTRTMLARAFLSGFACGTATLANTVNANVAILKAQTK